MVKLRTRARRRSRPAAEAFIATCITDARTESINSLVKQRFGLRVLQPSQRSPSDAAPLHR